MTINEQFRIATLERIARYTLGIAVERNTGVGTGTLVSAEGTRYILTAAHVIGDSKKADLRFWLRPPAPIVEKDARLTTDAEVGRYSAGIHLPIDDVGIDAGSDIAVLKLGDAFQVPDGCDVYDIGGSRAFMTWPEQDLDGLSLVLFGFPTDNSRPVARSGNRAFRFLGCASMLSNYSAALNGSVWSRLPSSLSQQKNFVFEYQLDPDDIEPHGFSGCGVWVLGSNPAETIWNPDPRLIGVTTNYFPKSCLLAATKLPAFVEMTVVG